MDVRWTLTRSQVESSAKRRPLRKKTKKKKKDVVLIPVEIVSPRLAAEQDRNANTTDYGSRLVFARKSYIA